VTTLALNRLGEREAGALVDGVTGGKSLPAEVLSRILDHADGIPLFIEELVAERHGSKISRGNIWAC
jgi:predicted ATPase